MTGLILPPQYVRRDPQSMRTVDEERSDAPHTIDPEPIGPGVPPRRSVIERLRELLRDAVPLNGRVIVELEEPMTKSAIVLTDESMYRTARVTHVGGGERLFDGHLAGSQLQVGDRVLVDASLGIMLADGGSAKEVGLPLMYDESAILARLRDTSAEVG